MPQLLPHAAHAALAGHDGPLAGALAAVCLFNRFGGGGEGRGGHILTTAHACLCRLPALQCSDCVKDMEAQWFTQVPGNPNGQCPHPPSGSSGGAYKA